jgi:hypothetical protein
MEDLPDKRVLTINGGSSIVRAALHRMSEKESLI